MIHDFINTIKTIVSNHSSLTIVTPTIDNIIPTIKDDEFIIINEDTIESTNLDDTNTITYDASFVISITTKTPIDIHQLIKDLLSVSTSVNIDVDTDYSDIVRITYNITLETILFGEN